MACLSRAPIEGCTFSIGIGLIVEGIGGGECPRRRDGDVFAVVPIVRRGGPHSQGLSQPIGGGDDLCIGDAGDAIVGRVGGDIKARDFHDRSGPSEGRFHRIAGLDIYRTAVNIGEIDGEGRAGPHVGVLRFERAVAVAEGDGAIAAVVIGDIAADVVLRPIAVVPPVTPHVDEGLCNLRRLEAGVDAVVVGVHIAQVACLSRAPIEGCTSPIGIGLIVEGIGGGECPRRRDSDVFAVVPVVRRGGPHSQGLSQPIGGGDDLCIGDAGDAIVDRIRDDIKGWHLCGGRHAVSADLHHIAALDVYRVAVEIVEVNVVITVVIGHPVGCDDHGPAALQVERDQDVALRRIAADIILVDVTAGASSYMDNGGMEVAMHGIAVSGVVGDTAMGAG